MGLFDWIRNFFRRLFGRRQSTTPAPQPVPAPQTGNPWTFVNCVRMPPYPTLDGDWVSFELGDGREVDMVLRKQVGLSGATAIRCRYTFDGKAEPTEGLLAKVSLMFMKAGADWTDQGDNVNGRWYWWGRPLGVGDTIEVPLTFENWHNVAGHQSNVKFNDAMANCISIGLAFGDPGSGATAHGIRGHGKFRFTFEIV